VTAHPSSRPPPRGLSSGLVERELEAVTVAMIVAPGVYARNRMFDFFRQKAAQQARKRAATIRGVVPQLPRAADLTVTRSSPTTFTLRYTIPAVSFTRVLELTDAELAALRLAAERANVTALPVTDHDRDLVARSLAKLMEA
jgi:hypothetical protein